MMVHLGNNRWPTKLHHSCLLFPICLQINKFHTQTSLTLTKSQIYDQVSIFVFEKCQTSLSKFHIKAFNLMLRNECVQILYYHMYSEILYANLLPNCRTYPPNLTIRGYDFIIRVFGTMLIHICLYNLRFSQRAGLCIG